MKRTSINMQNKPKASISKRPPNSMKKQKTGAIDSSRTSEACVEMRKICHDLKKYQKKNTFAAKGMRTRIAFSAKPEYGESNNQKLKRGRSGNK